MIYTSCQQLHVALKLHTICIGKPDLCQAFHDPGHADHRRHAPLRHFYRQALQLGYEDPKPILQLWHALASGPQAQGYHDDIHT